MYMKKIFLFLVLFFAAYYCVNAQQIFISKGKIEFEKRVNLYKDIEAWSDEDDNGDWIQTLKKSIPQFEVSYFDLFFDSSNKTLYKPGRELPRDPKVPDWFRGPATDNMVYADLNSQQTTSLKNVFEKTFLINDSTRKVEWRITNDERVIAGLDCRKAIGRIMDSIYVIAFYSEQVMISGGPESFNGLPGMIMGIAIPRINTTWFATKLELIEVKPSDILPPQKGKKVNQAELLKQLQGSMKDWGKSGQRNIWKIMI
jgi:GLPGLI family protein